MSVLNRTVNYSYKERNAWLEMSQQERKETLDMAEDYKIFISRAKTERETAAAIEEYIRSRGFRNFREKGTTLKPGDKVYEVFRGKAVFMAVVGSNDPLEGFNILGAHLDSPRLDLKPRPLYEDHGLAMLKTHYYGGIKKYQWPGLPLALHGVVVRADGTRLEVVIGENPLDPVLTISDLLPHLAREQFEKKVSDAFTGEDLNVLAGSFPLGELEQGDTFREAILDLLYNTYGIVEEDLISAELELVPAWMARDVGLDRSMVGGYGQDDRVCVFAAMRALGMIETPLNTAVGFFVDKEEIGSTGNTGMESHFFENCVAELLNRCQPDYDNLMLRRVLQGSRAISADVNAAMDPSYPSVMEKNNAAKLGCGTVITKYTGSGGKKSANDAHAEFVGLVRRLFNQHGVIWQTGELGKVDQGGGGTIAYLLARYGMDVLDCGVALLGMHSPLEVASKADIFMTWKGYLAFLENC